jgi:hypothetical protein
MMWQVMLLYVVVDTCVPLNSVFSAWASACLLGIGVFHWTAFCLLVKKTALVYGMVAESEFIPSSG